MNKFFSLVAVCALVLFSAFNAQAQKELSQGLIKMELTDVKSEDAAMAAQLGMLKGSTNEVYFNKSNVLTKIDMMGGMMQMNILVDPKTRAGFMLFDMEMMGKKLKVNITEEDAKKQKEASKNNEFKVTYDKADTKVVAGYKCHKAVITSPAMNGASITAYVTEDIKIKADVIQGISSDVLKGFPLEYNVGAKGMSMVYTTVEIKDTVDPSVFELKTAGYEEQSMEEFQKTMGAMGGGMGF